MYARATSIQVQPGRLDEAIQLYRDSLAPAAQAMTGFKGTTLLTDAKTGKCLGITFWETEADLKSSEEPNGYYHEQVAKFGPLLVGSPVVDRYEVGVKL